MNIISYQKKKKKGFDMICVKMNLPKSEIIVATTKKK